MSNILHSIQSEYLENCRTEEDNLILELELFAKDNNIPILNWNAAELLEQLITIKSPKKVLEIGTAIGYSTIRIAKNLLENSKIETIDFSKNMIKIANVNFDKSGLSKGIFQLDGNALEILPTLNSDYDFIFLDADKKDYAELFKLSVKLLKPRGVLFIDNLLWQGFTASKIIPEKYKSSTEQIREFNKLFMNELSLETTILPVGDGIGLGIKN